MPLSEELEILGRNPTIQYIVLIDSRRKEMQSIKRVFSLEHFSLSLEARIHF